MRPLFATRWRWTLPVAKHRDVECMRADCCPGHTPARCSGSSQSFQHHRPERCSDVSMKQPRAPLEENAAHGPQSLRNPIASLLTRRGDATTPETQDTPRTCLQHPNDVGRKSQRWFDWSGPTSIGLSFHWRPAKCNSALFRWMQVDQHLSIFHVQSTTFLADRIDSPSLLDIFKEA